MKYSNVPLVVLWAWSNACKVNLEKAPLILNQLEEKREEKV